MTEQEKSQLLAGADVSRVNGDYEAAQPIYERVLADFPDDTAAQSGLGHCLLNTGLFDESLDRFKRVVELLPSDVAALLTYGKALCMLGMFDEAKAQFERVLEIDPDNADAMEQMLYFPD